MDFAAVNVGQLKNMFSFDLQKDSDFDGFADWVETGTGIFVSPWDTGSSSSTNDTDGDGILDGAEVTAGTDPNSILGHVESLTLPGGASPRTTSFDVDELGRVRQITYPNGLEEAFSHDPVGNVTNHVDTGGRVTRFSYHPTSKLAGISRLADGATNTVSFTYDEQFSALSVTDPLGREVETYALDLAGRMTSVTNLDGQVMTVDYLVDTVVDTVTRFDGSGVTNSYDADGNLASVDYGGDLTEFSYLDNGLLSGASAGALSVSNAYDQAGRLTSTICAAFSGSVSYVYYPAGQVSNMQSAAGTHAFSNDAAGRVTQIASGDGTFTYAYNTNNGLVSSANCANTGIDVDYSYDVMDRVTGITWRDASDAVLRSFSYTRDDAGMIIAVSMADNESRSYTYDELDRLTGEQHVSAGSTARDTTFTYDAAGNRLSKAADGVTVAYAVTNNRVVTWNAMATDGLWGTVDVVGYSSETIGTNAWLGQLYVSNRVAQTPHVADTNYWAFSVGVNAGTQNIVAAIGDAAGNVGYATGTVSMTVFTNGSYAHDAAGSLTNIAYTGDGATDTVDLTWDSQYRLTVVSTNGTVASSYGYDPLGRRAWHCGGSTTNWLVYDGIHVIAEVDGAGALLKSYTWGPGIDNLLAFTDYTGGETNTYYALTDHLGTVHALADESGSIVESYRFDAWGRALGVYDGDGTPLSESAVGNHYLWQGRWYSWNTGLYYFRARWYDPITGRWLSKDPIGISGGLNQYVFCGNNPVNFIDPLGLLTWDPVVHHTGRNGRPVYDGEAFIGWYTDYLTQYRWRPWDLWGPGEFLENVDIAVDMSGENFYFRGECYEADEMGNVAAGYGLTAVWGTPVAIFGSVVAEGAGALDAWQNRGPGIRGVFGFYGQAIPDAWGSWSRNSIGWSHRQADDWNENVGDRTPIPGGL